MRIIELNKSFDVTDQVIIEDGKAVTYRAKKTLTGFQLAAMINAEQERINVAQRIVDNLINILERESE